MKYMVVECHTAYAVVLDENGRFIKVANLHYQVGQTVTDIVEMKLPETKPAKKFNTKWIYSIVAAAACFLFVFIPMLFMGGTTAHASVYMTINPQVRIDVNDKDQVIHIEAINDDGKDLISNYSYKNKELEDVVEELVSLAIEKDYLHEGGKVTLSLDTEDDEWVITHSESLNDHVNSYLLDKIAEVTVVVEDKNAVENTGSSVMEESSVASDIVSDDIDYDDDESDDMDDNEDDDDDESDDIDDDDDDNDESEDIDDDDDDESDDIDDDESDIDDDNDESDDEKDFDDDEESDDDNDRDESDDEDDEDDDIDELDDEDDDGGSRPHRPAPESGDDDEDDDEDDEDDD